MRVHSEVRHIYELYDAADKLGVLITEGPHKDTQDLQVPAFRWFNRWLKGNTDPVGMIAEKLLEPAQLKVFDSLPPDERTTTIHQTFVPTAENRVPSNDEEWGSMRDAWMKALREKVFVGWPDDSGPLDLQKAFSTNRDGLHLEAWDYNSQPHVRLRLYLLRDAATSQAQRIVLRPVDEEDWSRSMAGLVAKFPDALADEAARLASAATDFEDPRGKIEFGTTLVLLAPRGVGLTGFVDDAGKRIQIKRRFQLVGQTLEGMRVWDIVRSAEAIRSIPAHKDSRLRLSGASAMGVNTLYAGLFIPGVEKLDLANLPASHMDGPDYLNILRFLDIPEAVAMAAARSPVTLRESPRAAATYAAQTADALHWSEDTLTVAGD